MSSSFLLFSLLFLILSLYQNVLCQTPAERAKALLAQMTLDEKLRLVRGNGGPYVGNVQGFVVQKNNQAIPTLTLEDGPQGVADDVTLITCFPSALTVVATWDIEAMRAFGEATAEEQYLKGTNIMLGPMVNIARVPRGGRNFESYGEDPHLAERMAEENVRGIQSRGVIATVKHFVDNNQEYNRTTTSANLDERTQYEIYYPAYEGAIRAEVGAVMCSYNRINDSYACENAQTLNNDLKKTLGFKGWVMSDWFATHSTVQAANNGLDMQMPDDTFFGSALKQAVVDGKVPQSRIDDMVLRILTPMFAARLFDVPNHGNLSVNAQSEVHTRIARRLAAISTVLLKNQNNILPINLSKVKTIAVIGDEGDKNPIVHGGGSGSVIAPYVISPLKGIMNRTKNAGTTVTYAPTSPLSQAVANAKAADIAIVFVATTSAEGSDRPNLGLGTDQDNLVQAVAQAQPNTIVVAYIPGSTLFPWQASVPAILTGFMPGQEAGNAIADILFGDVNPSARLPVTFPQTEDQIPVNTPQQYPGINDEAAYSEQLLVGYRWYDAKQQTPLFPFGHGLSYTTFTYSNGNVNQTNRRLTITITNTGSVRGAEVVQVYLGFPSSAGEPPKVLRRFTRIELEPNQIRTIDHLFVDRDFSIWDISTHSWKVFSGSFSIYVGASSRDIRYTGTLTI